MNRNNNIVIYSPVIDTVNIFLKTTVEKIIFKKFNVIVLYNKKLSLGFEKNNTNINLITCLGNNKNPFSMLLDIFKIFKISNVNQYIFNGSMTIFLAILMKIIHPKDRINYIFHGTLESKGKFVNYIFLSLISIGSLVGIHFFCVNKRFDKYLYKKDRFIFTGIAGVGIHYDDISQILKYRKLISKPSRDINIFYIGRFEYSKGFDFFLNLSNKNTNNKYKFYAIGNDSYTKNIPHKTIFLGKKNRSDLFQCFSNIDILVLPSLSEGLGMVMVECCIAGIPVISSNTDGAKQFVKNLNTGIIIEDYDYSNYFSAIDHIYDNQIYFNKNCLNYSDENFNFESKPLNIFS